MFVEIEKTVLFLSFTGVFLISFGQENAWDIEQNCTLCYSDSRHKIIIRLTNN